MKIKPIPELIESQPYARLEELYRKLGWDGKKDVDSSKVRLSEDDWLAMLSREIEHAKTVITGMNEIDIRIAVGMLWANMGPSGGGKHPGMVELCPGWLEEPEMNKNAV